VVFYCADCVNLLPVVRYKNNRREFNDDEPESSQKIPVLDKKNTARITLRVGAERAPKELSIPRGKDAIASFFCAKKIPPKRDLYRVST
jgi:hypothetical protein